MPRPGVTVEITEGAAVGGLPLDTGQAFMVGLAERGPTQTPAEVRAIRTYERIFGARIGGPVLHDAMRAFFTEGGAVAYVLRLAGPGAQQAQGTVGPLTARANSAGTWGNQVTVALETEGGIMGTAFAMAHWNGNGNGNGNGEKEEGEAKPKRSKKPIAGAQTSGGPVRVVVRQAGDIVERSPAVSVAQDAVDWSQGSQFLTLEASNPTATLEAVSPVTLSGGANDNTVNPTIVANTLARFGSGLGTGQMLYPGATDPLMHAAVMEAAQASRRVALLDLNDEDEFTIASDAVGLASQHAARFAAAYAPRLRYPGSTVATTILMPPSPVVAGVIARRDRMTANPNEAAAGDVAYTQARGLRIEFTDDTREQLNELGVSLFKVRGRPAVTFVYGSRSISNNPVFRWFGGARVVAAIANEADSVAGQFVHRQIDGQGRIFLELNSVLTAICARYYSLGALYGETDNDAYQVDTSSAVNTVDTIQNGEIHAQIRLRTSPSAEWVVIEVQKTLSLTAAAA